jgi:hypothetical protein
MGRADPGDSHPIINEWEGAQEGAARCGWSGPFQGNLYNPQTFPTSSLAHFLYKNEFTIFIPVQITIRRGLW